MRIIIGILIAMIAVVATTRAQDKHSPYKGEEGRQIKALSSEDITAYLSGQGMGLAKAAELNHYPGPKHVLDLAVDLKLSDKQAAETRASYDRMHSEATRLGAVIVEKERHLDHLFALKHIDAERLKSVTDEIAKLQGELRFVHLRAHLEMRQILTAEQIEKYAQLRGYKDGSHSHGDHQKKKH
ncbi:MAG TPA: periplasmic heavy metal sensor [Blastocatellia bacterium]|nr:periplasmic heavy metal sensor [Blastocatellia bacterium]